MQPPSKNRPSDETLSFGDSQVFLAPAKVNGALHILGRKDSPPYAGYHLLDSLVFFADYGDRLIAEPSQAWEVHFCGPFASQLERENNSVLRAAMLLNDHLSHPLSPRRFILEKNLPVASGLGGGSSDAACVLKILAQDHPEISPALLSFLGLQLGADVPVCLNGRTARMEGVGECVTEYPFALDDLRIKDSQTRHARDEKLYALLVNPGEALSTAEIFKRRSGPFSAPLVFETTLRETLLRSHNDLEPWAIQKAPSITTVLNALSTQKGCWLSRLSGSGATCFGLFETKHDALFAETILQQTHPHWWSKAVTLGNKDLSECV